jgi:hypothetical protein
LSTEGSGYITDEAQDEYECFFLHAASLQRRVSDCWRKTPIVLGEGFDTHGRGRLAKHLDNTHNAGIGSPLGGLLATRKLAHYA